MKTSTFLRIITITVFFFSGINSFSQKKISKTIESNASNKQNKDLAKLKKIENTKMSTKVEESRGPVFPNLSDINVTNDSRFSVEIYVSGRYRMTLSPFSGGVTWGIPGNNELYAVANFTDGTYLWWRLFAQTGYTYNWRIYYR